MLVYQHPLATSYEDPFVDDFNNTPKTKAEPTKEPAHSLLKNIIWKKRKQNTFSIRGFQEFCFVLLWNVVLSLLAACITFWIPSITLWGINITSMTYNIIGSFIYAFITTLQQVRYQYYQTYILYDAISGGFCSVLTTFGNFIVDTGMQYGFLKALINWTGTLALSFTMYQIGRLIALKWKSGAKFSFDLLNMENEDRRIQHEVEKEELRRLNEETISSGTNYGSQTSAFTKLTKLEQHLVEQMDKKKRHVTKHMKARHVLIIVATLVFVLANFVAVGILQYTTWNTEQNIFAYDFCISLLMCVLGALAGRYIRMIGKPDRRGHVQWGTFRVNMLSCIIIGTAHNILLLRRYIYGDSPHLTIVFQRLIGNFCGAESNFGGFIDETTVLWNSKGCRVEAVRNFFYNLVLCTIVFFMVVLSVRLAFFYDVRILV